MTYWSPSTAMTTGYSITGVVLANATAPDSITASLMDLSSLSREMERELLRETFSAPSCLLARTERKRGQRSLNVLWHPECELEPAQPLPSTRRLTNDPVPDRKSTS